MKIERLGDVIVARMDDHYSGLDEEAIEGAEEQIFAAFRDDERPRLVVDLSQTNYFGSTFIEMLLRAWRHVHHVGGQFAIGGISDCSKEILLTARLDTLWHLYDSPDEAVRQLATETSNHAAG